MRKKVVDILDYISSTKFGKIIKTSVYNHLVHNVEEGQIVLTDIKKLIPLVDFIKCDPGLYFASLISICGVDYLGSKEKRFEVVYLFLSIKYNIRLKLKIEVDENDKIPSLAEVFKSSVWYEREIYDMFGLQFEGNPDMRRILTDYNFEHFPLRKDFPITGYEEVYYDLENKEVSQRSVVLSQAYRNFDFAMPWNGDKVVKENNENSVSDSNNSVKNK